MQGGREREKEAGEESREVSKGLSSFVWGCVEREYFSRNGGDECNSFGNITGPLC